MTVYLDWTKRGPATLTVYASDIDGYNISRRATMDLTLTTIGTLNAPTIAETGPFSVKKDSELTLTINGGQPEGVEDLHYKVIVTSDSDMDDYGGSWTYGSYDTNAISVTPHMNAGEYTLEVAAFAKGYEEVRSAKIPLTVTSEGPLPELDYSLSANPIQKGQPQVITIENLDEYPDGFYMYGYLYHTDGNGNRYGNSMYCNFDREAGAFTIPTEGLDADVYVLDVHKDAPGWDYDNNDEIVFTVVG